jgi:hypothetical protein
MMLLMIKLILLKDHLPVLSLMFVIINLFMLIWPI